MDQRTVRGERIGRSSERRGDDDAVRTDTSKVFPVHGNLNGKDSGYGAASHNDVIGGMALADGLAFMDDRPDEDRAGVDGEFAGKELPENRFPVVAGNFREKADLTEVDAEQGNPQSRQLARNPDKGSVSTKNDCCLNGMRRCEQGFLRTVGGKSRAGNTARLKPLPDLGGGVFGEPVAALGNKKNRSDGLHPP